jgi:hypothetical protein
MTWDFLLEDKGNIFGLDDRRAAVSSAFTSQVDNRIDEVGNFEDDFLGERINRRAGIDLVEDLWNGVFMQRVRLGVRWGSASIRRF